MHIVTRCGTLVEIAVLAMSLLILLNYYLAIVPVFSVVLIAKPNPVHVAQNVADGDGEVGGGKLVRGTQR